MGGLTGGRSCPPFPIDFTPARDVGLDEDWPEPLVRRSRERDEHCIRQSGKVSQDSASESARCVTQKAHAERFRQKRLPALTLTV